MRLHIIAFSFNLLTTWGQRSFTEELQRLYLGQGLPYRENAFLDNKPILPEYDFVVIGSGPGGSTVANRLTEEPGWSVLLLEGGPDPNIYTDIPLINPVSILGNFSKFYLVEKNDKACQGLYNEQCRWPAGEAVGGATIINAMIYTRGHPSDFDEWAAEGNTGWSYNDVLPYFRKHENMAIPTLRNSKYHGKGGPVNIEYSTQTKIGQRFIKGLQEMGYNEVDYNNPTTTVGVSRSQTTMKRGKRVSATSAYLFPARNRPNLHITKNTPATKILVDAKTKRAYGVQFRRKGADRTVMARKEVIISAGAINSPKLLMLSGIGHREHLQQLNIPVIQNLPVGDNLQEHLGTPLLNFLINTTESIVFPKVFMNAPTHFVQWLNGEKGILSHNGAEALGYILTPLAKGKADMELIFIPITPGTDAGAMLRKTISIKDELFKGLWEEKNYFLEGFTVCPMVMYPRSRGTIRLRSKDFDDPPIINANFFDDPYDVEVIIAGIKEVLKLVQTNSLQAVGTRQHSVPLGLCKQFPFNSDEYWNCTIRAVPIQWHHQCGTCKMGPNPKTSVVDSRLRVHGIKGLRVVDASIMPRIPGPHTMAPTYMIAEKASDLIKEEHKGRYFVKKV